jgi:hypothetical protein
MIVPQFWAEGRIRGRIAGRQVTIRRFGWSDASQAEAQAHAQQRAREAYDLKAAGQEVPRRELKRPYNGSEGVPIREEIVNRHGDTVITRNSYGALCLNTPNVLFADIDLEWGPSTRLVLSLCGFILVGAIVVGWLWDWKIGVAAGLLSWLVGYVGAWSLDRLRVRVAGGPEQHARQRLERFLSAHPNWHVRLYRTPAGLRVLAMHQTFDPNEPQVAECFRALRTDPIYVRMCQRQRCFRARVSPKPWRVGVGHHMKPRPGVWPINPERMPDRLAWIAEYERAAAGYAACQFVAALGSGRVDPAAAEVQRLHDELCQSNRPLPIA